MSTTFMRMSFSGGVIVTTFDNFPVTGDSETLYVASDRNKTYIWNGSSYNAVGDGSGTTDYIDLSNKPTINNVELNGDKSATDLGFTDFPVSSGNETRTTLSASSWASHVEGINPNEIKIDGGQEYVYATNLGQTFVSVDELLELYDSGWSLSLKSYGSKSQDGEATAMSDGIKIKFGAAELMAPSMYIKLNGDVLFAEVAGYRDSTDHLYINANSVKCSKSAKYKYTINDASVTSKSNIFIQYNKDVILYSKSVADGSFVIGCQIQPTENIEITYKIIQTSGTGHIQLSNLYIPSKISQLQNDSGFITLADLPIYNGGVQ